MTRFFGVVVLVTGVLAITASAAFAAFNGEFLVGGGAANLVAVHSHSNGVILLEDMTAKAGVECEATDEGIVGGFGAENKPILDETTKVVFANCSSEIGCAVEKDIEVFALNLPWKTVLSVDNKGMAGEKVLDTISPGVVGNNPGYEVKCLVGGILIADKCTKASATVEITNGVNDINALFNTGEEAECSVGGAKAGLVEGTEVIETVGGAALQVS